MLLVFWIITLASSQVYTPSQVLCPSEDSESIILCSNLPGGMFKYWNVCILDHTLFDQKWIQNISSERVSEDNTRWVRCTNINILYWNIVSASYYFSVVVVAEWYSFCWCVRKAQKQQHDFWSEMNTKYLIWKGCRVEDNARWVRCTTIHIEY